MNIKTRFKMKFENTTQFTRSYPVYRILGQDIIKSIKSMETYDPIELYKRIGNIKEVVSLIEVRFNNKNKNLIESLQCLLDECSSEVLVNILKSEE